jgi:hypothetical protein
MFNYRADAPLPPVDYQPHGSWLYGAAMFYASAGLPLVANQPGTKRVAWQVHGTGWQDWNSIALTSPEQVHAAWYPYPAYCLGLVTGRISRVLVIDGDVKGGQDPAQELAKWAYETGIKLPAGPIARTATKRNGRNGFHRYLYLPDDAPVIGTVTGWLPGVDIICEQRQVLLAPSWNDKRQPAEHEPLTAQQYMWQLDGFGDYYPTAEDLRDTLEAAVAPAGFLEDVLSYGGSRTEKARLRALRKGLPKGSKVDNEGLVLDKDGHIDVEWYEQHGAPDNLQEKVLLRLATKLCGHMALPIDEAIERCWRYIQKCENTDPTWPWTRDDVVKKVQRQNDYVGTQRAREAAQIAEAIAFLNKLQKKGN